MNFLFQTKILFLCFLLACSQEDQDDTILGNLTVTFEFTEDNPATVFVKADASNADYYEFYPGDNTENIINKSGLISYTYTSSGSYATELKAYDPSGMFRRHNETLTIILDEKLDMTDGYVTPLNHEGYALVWQDEFNGSSLNTSLWNYEIGRGSNGWGNNELQYYRQENATVENGYLTIQVKNETFNGALYTSSRLTTQNKYQFQYGRVDIRARMPYGQGLWPALWMLGANITSIGWPACGEIDIMEMIGGGEGRDDTVHGTIHWQDPNGNAGNNNHAYIGGSKQLQEGTLADEFHVYTVIWDDEKIIWYLDDQQYFTNDITNADLMELRNQFFFIINVAVGGNWPGSPTSATVFPQKMNVDYIRVFQPN